MTVIEGTGNCCDPNSLKASLRHFYADAATTATNCFTGGRAGCSHRGAKVKNKDLFGSKLVLAATEHTKARKSVLGAHKHKSNSKRELQVCMPNRWTQIVEQKCWCESLEVKMALLSANLPSELDFAHPGPLRWWSMQSSSPVYCTVMSVHHTQSCQHCFLLLVSLTTACTWTDLSKICHVNKCKCISRCIMLFP